MSAADANFSSILNQDGSSWYALYTRHQHERAVADGLVSRSFEVFLPLYSAVHAWKDRKKQLEIPLFPGYVFLKGPLDRRLDILKTPGVCYIVSTNGVPNAIPGSEIDPIHRVIQSSVPVEPYPSLATGDRVRIKSGLLAGIEGVLVHRKGRYHLILCVQLLCRSAAVDVDISDIELVSTPGIRTAPPYVIPAGNSLSGPDAI